MKPIRFELNSGCWGWCTNAANVLRKKLIRKNCWIKANLQHVCSYHSLFCAEKSQFSYFRVENLLNQQFICNIFANQFFWKHNGFVLSFSNVVIPRQNINLFKTQLADMNRNFISSSPILVSILLFLQWKRMKLNCWIRLDRLENMLNGFSRFSIRNDWTSISSHLFLLLNEKLSIHQ